MLERVDVDPMLELLDDRPGGAGGVLDRRSGPPGAAARTLIQQTIASSSRAAIGGSSGSTIMSPREMSSSSAHAQRDRHRREGGVDLAVEGVDRRDPRPLATGQHQTSSPGLQHAAGHLCRRSRGSRGARRSSAGSPIAPGSGRPRDCGRARSPRAPGGRAAAARRTTASPCERSTTLSPCSAEIGMNVMSAIVQPRGPVGQLLDDPGRRRPRRSRPGPSCSRTRPGAGSAAATRCRRGGASARSRPCARRRARSTDPRSRRR